jgi:integral membrane sensor domain MASE1
MLFSRLARNDKMLLRSAGALMKRILLVATLGLLLSKEAHAYLDPGSASLWVQGIVAAVAAVAATARIWWWYIKSKFKGKKPE